MTHRYNFFLMERKQYVKVCSSLSRCTKVLSCVPQGTVLGPLLFLCFSADITGSVNTSTLSIYLDDTEVFKGVADPADRQLLQNDLNAVFSWAELWQLSLNPCKTKHLRLGKCRYDFVYHLNGRPIDKVDNICDIGVYIQSNLKFTTHCNQLVKKAHFSIRNIFNTFKGHDMEFYVSLYQTYVRPILEYNSPAWSPHLKVNIYRLESVQRYFLLEDYLVPATNPIWNVYLNYSLTV